MHVLLFRASTPFFGKPYYAYPTAKKAITSESPNNGTTHSIGMSQNWHPRGVTPLFRSRNLVRGQSWPRNSSENFDSLVTVTKEHWATAAVVMHESRLNDTMVGLLLGSGFPSVQPSFWPKKGTVSTPIYRSTRKLLKVSTAQQRRGMREIELTPLEDWEEATLRFPNELVAFHHVVVEALHPESVLIHDVHFHRLDMAQRVGHKQD